MSQTAVTELDDDDEVEEWPLVIRKVDAILVSLDAKKAFDSVDH